MPSREELLAAIRARPDDDAPRLVYADFLLEEGDPRGELIMLQCQGKADDPRVAELIAAQERTWVRGAQHCKRIVWRRGFPAELHLSPSMPRSMFSVPPYLSGGAVGGWLRAWKPDGGPEPAVLFGRHPVVFDATRARAALIVSACTNTDPAHDCAPDFHGDGQCSMGDVAFAVTVPDGQTLTSRALPKSTLTSFAFSDDGRQLILVGDVTVEMPLP